ncbi:MAG: tRNA (cytidine(34)-2'-O)-methyltransferase [Chroococcidiopsis cubana SAG 39.79]|nr:tRNA (cytidine(34)-2'-O)-methyltransferase [Chroococcidiopsis cubana SAG 39.79]
MPQLVLVHPQIPPNTGNIARTCAATGTELHLVAPLGFEISDRYLKRAGLDYWQYVNLHYHESLDSFKTYYLERGDAGLALALKVNRTTSNTNFRLTIGCYSVAKQLDYLHLSFLLVTPEFTFLWLKLAFAV